MSGGGVKSRLITNDKGHAIGQRVTVEVVKNKLFPPFRKADTDLYFGMGFSPEGELFDLGVDMGFIDRGGSWFIYGEAKAQGREKFVVLLQQDRELFAKLEKDVRLVLGQG